MRSVLMRALALIVIGCVARVLWFALVPFEHTDLWKPDDAYITLVIASEMAATGLPTFEGVLNNGFQPLFTFMLAGLVKALGFASAVDERQLVWLSYVGVALSNAGYMLGLPFGMELVERHTRRAIANLFGVFWVLQPTLWVASNNGMETGWAATALVMILWWTSRYELESAPYRTLVGLGVLLGGSILARVDVVLVGIFFAWSALRMLPAMPWREWCQRVGAVIGPMFALLTPWFVYSYWHTGRILQISGQAVRQLGHEAGGFDRAIAVSVIGMVSFSPLLVVMGSLFVWRTLRGEGRAREIARQLAPALAFSIVVVVFYTFYMKALFVERYFIGVFITMLLWGLYHVHDLTRGLARSRQLVGAGVAAFIVVAGWCVAPPGIDKPTVVELIAPSQIDRVMASYYLPALWLRDNVPEDVVVGAPQAGAIAYWAPHHEIVNLDGVVSEEALLAKQRGALDEYIDASGVGVLYDVEGVLRAQVWMRARGDYQREFDCRILGEVQFAQQLTMFCERRSSR